jgi:nitroreductase
MDAMEVLRRRYSASKLGELSPPAEAIEAMLEAAVRAPDHGRLRPWRLILIEGEARRALGDLLAESLARRNPLAGEPVLAREREKALRAPLIIVVATRFDLSAKIPVVEQIVCAGCAAHGLILASFAQGLGAFWRTGEAAYDEAVKGALGIGADDLILGFIYIGTDAGAAPPSRPRPPVQDFAQRWTGDSRKPTTS